MIRCHLAVSWSLWEIAAFTGGDLVWGSGKAGRLACVFEEDGRMLSKEALFIVLYL